MRTKLYLLFIALTAAVLWYLDDSEMTNQSEPKSAPLGSRPAHGPKTALLLQGDRIITGDESGSLLMKSLNDASAPSEWVAHSAAIRRIMSRGTELVTVSADGSVARWDQNGVPIKRDRLVGHHLNDAVLLANGGVIVAADRGTVARIDTGNRWKVSSIHGRAAFTLSLSEYGDKVASGGADGYLRIWSTVDGKELGAWLAHPKGWTTRVLWTRRGVMSAGSDGRLKLWSESGEEIWSRSVSEEALISLSESVDLDIVGSERGDVAAIDKETGQIRHRTLRSGPVMSITSHGDVYAVSDQNGSVSIWRMTDGVQTGTLLNNHEE